MRKIITTVIISLVAFSGVGTATALHNGTPVQENDLHAPGVVQISACTGTIVDTHWVLTAQHCVEVPELRRSVYVGSDRGEQSRREENRYVSDYAVWAPEGDVALAHVVQPLPTDRIRKVRSSVVNFGGAGSVYGWGAGTLNRLKTAQAYVGRSAPGIRAFSGKHTAFLVQYSGNAKTGRGDSGGPLFIGDEIAGVTSFIPGRGDGVFAYFASLHNLNDWIKKTIEDTGNRDNVNQKSHDGLNLQNDNQSSRWGSSFLSQ